MTRIVCTADIHEHLPEIPECDLLLIAGNHDQSIEAWGVPAGLRCHYLEDAGAELCGLKVWGTPWQPWFYDWAFNAPREDGEHFLAEKFALIPGDVDVVICHGPPLGYGDQGKGSSALTDAIQRVRPQLVLGGHIHPGYGRYRLGETEIINAAYVDDDYKPANPLVEIEL